MGRAVSSEEAAIKLEQFLDYGVDPNCIGNHPNNRNHSLSSQQQR
jgi:hypothetical protein